MRAVKGIYVNERAIGREWKYKSTNTIGFMLMGSIQEVKNTKS